MNYKKLRTYFDKAYGYKIFARCVDLYLTNGNNVSALLQRQWQYDEFMKEVRERNLERIYF